MPSVYHRRTNGVKGIEHIDWISIVVEIVIAVRFWPIRIADRRIADRAVVGHLVIFHVEESPSAAAKDVDPIEFFDFAHDEFSLRNVVVDFDADQVSNLNQLFCQD